MAAIETQQLRMLEQLRQSGEQPITLDQLRAVGLTFPPLSSASSSSTGS